MITDRAGEVCRGGTYRTCGLALVDELGMNGNDLGEFGAYRLTRYGTTYRRIRSPEVRSGAGAEPVLPKRGSAAFGNLLSLDFPIPPTVVSTGRTPTVVSSFGPMRSRRDTFEF